MKKVLALLLAAVMIFSFAACGGEKKEEGPDVSSYKVPTDQDIEIEFWHSYSNQKRADWIQARADEFTAMYPNVKINLVCTGGHPATRDMVAGALSAGTGLCAMSTINAPQVQVYASSGVTEPWDNYFLANDVDPKMYNDGMMDAGTYDKDGLIHGVPFGVSAGVCYYNKTLTEAAGAKIPDTWDEFKDWCYKVSAYTGTPAFGFAYDFNYLNTFFLNVTGMDPLGDGKVSKLDDPSMLKFVKEVRQMISDGVALYMGVTIDKATDDQMAAFKTQQIAGFTTTSSDCVKAAAAAKEAGFEMDYRIGVGNNGKEAITTVSGAFIVLYADQSTQAQKNAAAAFILYMINEENNKVWANDTIMFPEVKGTTVEGLLAQYPEMEGVFGHGDRVITKNKVSCMQKCMTAVAGVFGDIVKGDVPEGEIEAKWATLKTEVDGMLADAQ